MKIKATIDKQELEIEVDDKALEKAGYVKEKKEWKRWRAKKGKSYFYFVDGDICDTWEYGDEFDNVRYVLGNYYQTRELAQKALDRQLALVKVNDRILELNEGWEQNLDTRHESKWHIVYSYETSSFETRNSHLENMSQNTDCLQSHQKAFQIISECKDDLKIIFGV